MLAEFMECQIVKGKLHLSVYSFWIALSQVSVQAFDGY